MLVEKPWFAIRVLVNPKDVQWGSVQDTGVPPCQTHQTCWNVMQYHELTIYIVMLEQERVFSHCHKVGSIQLCKISLYVVALTLTLPFTGPKGPKH